MAEFLNILDRICMGLALFTGAFSALQAVGQLLIRPFKSVNGIGFLLLLWLAVIMANLGLGREIILDHLPYLYALHAPFYYLVGPLLSSYLLGLLKERESDHDEEFDLSFPGMAALVPFFLASVAYIPFFLMSGEGKRAVLYPSEEAVWVQAYDQVLRWIVYLGLAHGIFSMVRTLLRINVFALLHADSKVPGLWHLRALPVWIAFINTVAIPIQFFDTVPLKRLGIAGVAVGVLWLYLLDFRYPGFFRRVDREIRKRQKLEKYSRSSLQSLDVQQIQDRLQRLMEEDRVFVDGDLSLERLADWTGISAGQLSELLNNVMGVDFRSYVNGFRVREAYQMLMDEPDRKVDSIAEAVGFNSRASFYRNFRLITGKTAAMVRAGAKNPVDSPSKSED
ncbi:MAG TPA: hypothetical protein DEA96_05040 [Leptospiraceae bacterium]|nr:hypothetical protein [Spirochaetaceae bacterium]HBS04310.1 hypothetical protein [Leptospiraceae bacterium]